VIGGRRKLDETRIEDELRDRKLGRVAPKAQQHEEL
jgi:hypothetical protein